MKSQATPAITKGATITMGHKLVYAILVTRSSTMLKPSMTIIELDTNIVCIIASHAIISFGTLVHWLITKPNFIKIATVVFVDSPFNEGKPNGYFRMKSKIWTDADNNCAGMLLFVFDDSFGFEHDMPMYFGLSFRDFMSGKLSSIPGELPTLNDWENHLATIFPEGRLKGNLEMRGADGGPWRRLCALPAFWVKVLIYIEGSEVNQFVGVGARLGPTLESKEKHANQTRLALADPPHCCRTPKNQLTEGVMLVHQGNCSFMAKADVAESDGASAILIINNRADFGRYCCVLFFWISATCLCCLNWFHITVQNSFSFPCGSSVKRYHSR